MPISALMCSVWYNGWGLGVRLPDVGVVVQFVVECVSTTIDTFAVVVCFTVSIRQLYIISFKP